jgi:hypothetical protein
VVSDLQAEDPGHVLFRLKVLDGLDFDCLPCLELALGVCLSGPLRDSAVADSSSRGRAIAEGRSVAAR